LLASNRRFRWCPGCNAGQYPAFDDSGLPAGLDLQQISELVRHQGNPRRAATDGRRPDPVRRTVHPDFVLLGDRWCELEPEINRLHRGGSFYGRPAVVKKIQAQSRICYTGQRRDRRHLLFDPLIQKPNAIGCESIWL